MSDLDMLSEMKAIQKKDLKILDENRQLQNISHCLLKALDDIDNILIKTKESLNKIQGK